MIKIIDAKYEGDYQVWLRFDDGVSGVVDLEGDLWGAVFEPLRNLEKFKGFEVSPIMHTLVWGDGADLAPEYLREKLKSECKS